MPSVEHCLLLLLIGGATGALTAAVNIAPALIALPALYFFLPVFGMSLEQWMLPAIATSITAFLPVHLSSWIKAMKKGEVDYTRLLAFSPGVAMGSVIGAQTLSIINFLVFKIAFTCMAILAVCHLMLEFKKANFKSFTLVKAIQLPIGMAVGFGGTLSGVGVKVLSDLLGNIINIQPKMREGTSEGLMLFGSIAALVGFIYPAKPFNHFEYSYFAGAVHLPSVLVLAGSHYFFHWVCLQKVTYLDKKVMSAGAIVYLVCSLLRFWA